MTDTPKTGAASTDEVQDAVIVKKSRFSLIWLLPLVVVVTGGWMVWKNYQDRGIPVIEYFESGAGIEAGKTLIKHKGVAIGMVNDITLDLAKNRVKVSATLRRDDDEFSLKGARYWLVKPRISLQKISGLDTLVSGPYISATPGSGKTAGSFTALAEPPAAEAGHEGLRIILEAGRMGSVKAGDHVYYRQYPIGQIIECHLSRSAQKILMAVTIDGEYAHLVHENSVFWNTSGIGVKLNIFHSKLQTAPLEDLISGGIAMATPDNEHMGERAKNGARFTLHDDGKDKWLEWSPDLDPRHKDEK